MLLDAPVTGSRQSHCGVVVALRANRMGEILRKMFTLAMEWEWRSDNPAQGFHRRIEHARERFLSPEELVRLAAVLDTAEDQRAASIRVVFGTGC